MATKFAGILILLGLNFSKSAAQAVFTNKADSSQKFVSLKVLPQNFYKQHLGFFCKKELELQKQTGTNLYIRLGSKEYVDYLEQKPNAKNN